MFTCALKLTTAVILPIQLLLLVIGVFLSALTVAPLAIARGTQNKILESLALGVPVICSPVAAGGVDVVVPDHMLVADDPKSWVDQISSILDDPARRAQLSAAGRERMATHHDWPTSMTRVDALLEKALELAK